MRPTGGSACKAMDRSDTRTCTFTDTRNGLPLTVDHSAPLLTAEIEAHGLRIDGTAQGDSETLTLQHLGYEYGGLPSAMHSEELEDTSVDTLAKVQSTGKRWASSGHRSKCWSNVVLQSQSWSTLPTTCCRHCAVMVRARTSCRTTTQQ